MKNLNFDPKEVADFFSQFKSVKKPTVEPGKKYLSPNHKQNVAKWRAKNKLYTSEYDKDYRKHNKDKINAASRKRYAQKKLDGKLK